MSGHISRNTEDTATEEIIALLNVSLDSILEVIAKRLNPGQVFEDDELRDYVAENFEPSDTFSDKRLEEWALDNGFVKE